MEFFICVLGHGIITTLPFHMLYVGSPVNANKRSCLRKVSRHVMSNTTNQSLPSKYRFPRFLRVEKTSPRLYHRYFGEFEVFKASFSVISAPKRQHFFIVPPRVESRQNANYPHLFFFRCLYRLSNSATLV